MKSYAPKNTPASARGKGVIFVLATGYNLPLLGLNTGYNKP